MTSLTWTSTVRPVLILGAQIQDMGPGAELGTTEALARRLDEPLTVMRRALSTMEEHGQLDGSHDTSWRVRDLTGGLPVERAACALRRDIFTGALAPGRTRAHGPLARQYDVASDDVADAAQLLTEEGLLVGSRTGVCAVASAAQIELRRYLAVKAGRIGWIVHLPGIGHRVVAATADGAGYVAGCEIDGEPQCGWRPIGRLAVSVMEDGPLDELVAAAQRSPARTKTGGTPALAPLPSELVATDMWLAAANAGGRTALLRCARDGAVVWASATWAGGEVVVTDSDADGHARGARRRLSAGVAPARTWRAALALAPGLHERRARLGLLPAAYDAYSGLRRAQTEPAADVHFHWGERQCVIQIGANTVRCSTLLGALFELLIAGDLIMSPEQLSEAAARRGAHVALTPATTANLVGELRRVCAEAGITTFHVIKSEWRYRAGFTDRGWLGVTGTHVHPRLGVIVRDGRVLRLPNTERELLRQLLDPAMQLRSTREHAAVFGRTPNSTSRHLEQLRRALAPVLEHMRGVWCLDPSVQVVGPPSQAIQAQILLIR